MTIQELLTLTIKNNASDLHLLPGVSPCIRLDGAISPLTSYRPLTHEEVDAMIFSLINPAAKELLTTNKELDFSIGFHDQTSNRGGRFRVNAFYQSGYLTAAFRFLPTDIQTVEELNLPKIVNTFSTFRQGLVLVCGPTGHGKSSTLAALINDINLKNPYHILTIEDPIEYIYPKGKSIVSQREMGIDTHSWSSALRSSLREDPDIVLIGEMRDTETIQSALTIAETGHLVFSTLHTNSASQSIDRMVGAFPPHEQDQVRLQLAATLRGIISQRLIPKIGGGRIPAVEILIGTNAVSSNIREGKTHLIDSIIQTSQEAGMISLETSLAQLVQGGSITLDVAKQYVLREQELLRLLV